MLKPEEVVKGQEVFCTMGNWCNGVYYRYVDEVGVIVKVNKATMHVQWESGIITERINEPHIFPIASMPKAEHKAEMLKELGEVLRSIGSAVEGLKDRGNVGHLPELKKILEILNSMEEHNATNC